MEVRGCLSVCLCVYVVGGGVFAFHATGNEAHGQICGANERLLSCGGCQKTCLDPAPDCKGICKTGCYCNEDEVRNETGHCIKLADCPSVAPAKLQSSEPRHTDLECPTDEEYRSCEPCNKTCDNPNPVCPAQCARGCFCRDNLVRDKDGRCVKLADCSNLKKKEDSNLIKPVIPLAYKLTCGPHQVYSSCRTCEWTCNSPTQVCTTSCTAGCFCQVGFFKGPDGQCVKLEDCPKEKCTDPNEEYVCRYGTESRCDGKKSLSRPLRCVLGCHCRLGLYRDMNGLCVTPDRCRPNSNTTSTSINLLNLNSSETPSLNAMKSIVEIAIPIQDLESPKSVFGPIPEGAVIYHHLPEGAKPFDGGNTKPYKDVISRAAKFYKDFVIGNPSTLYNTDVYAPKPVKGMSPRRYRDDNGMLTKDGIKMNDVGNSQFFVNQESKPPKDANVKNYMSDLITIMKEMMPPMNFTILQV